MEFVINSLHWKLSSELPFGAYWSPHNSTAFITFIPKCKVLKQWHCETVAKLWLLLLIVKGKGKVSCPATHHEGAWGERRYSSYSFLTLALDGGEWSASCPSRALPLGKGPPVPTGLEVGWTPEPVWTQRLEEKSCASVGDRTMVVQSVVSHYTDWATPAPCYYWYIIKSVA
jgi:hypothetical protein